MAKKKKAAPKKAGKKGKKPAEGLSRALLEEQQRAKAEKENGPVPPSNSGVAKGKKKAKKKAKKEAEPQKPTTPPHLAGPPGLTRR